MRPTRAVTLLSKTGCSALPLVQRLRKDSYRRSYHYSISEEVEYLGGPSNNHFSLPQDLIIILSFERVLLTFKNGDNMLFKLY